MVIVILCTAVSEKDFIGSFVPRPTCVFRKKIHVSDMYKLDTRQILFAAREVPLGPKTKLMV